MKATLIIYSIHSTKERLDEKRSHRDPAANGRSVVKVLLILPRRWLDIYKRCDAIG